MIKKAGAALFPKPKRLAEEIREKCRDMVLTALHKGSLL